MMKLVFADGQLNSLKLALAHPKLESAAILLARPVLRGEDDMDSRLLILEIHVAADDDYAERTPTSVTLRSEFCLPLEKRAKLEGLSLVYCHTHVHRGTPRFSGIDDQAEAGLITYLDARGIHQPHGALVLSEDALVARKLGTDEFAEVSEVGRTLTFAGVLGSFHTPEHDRQVLAFGRLGQAKIASLRVAVVGLGGTGSLVVQQLAYLGVRNFALIDDDIVESTNLNRLVGATPADVGSSKVKVASRVIRTLRSDAVIEAVEVDVTAPNVWQFLSDADFVFSCTDTHASRHLVNQFAYQYRVPVIDMGVSITHHTERLQLAGHVKMVAPGLPCLWCANHLDPQRVREELMSEEQRAADPYFQGGEGVEQPSVISLNSTVASLAVTMFLAAVTGIPAEARYLTYDANRGRVHAMADRTNEDCPFCGTHSSAGAADAFPLPQRGHG
jgi:molybdopterin/thiamine biosynthesis adenylyltransferase